MIENSGDFDSIPIRQDNPDSDAEDDDYNKVKIVHVKSLYENNAFKALLVFCLILTISFFGYIFIFMQSQVEYKMICKIQPFIVILGKQLNVQGKATENLKIRVKTANDFYFERLNNFIDQKCTDLTYLPTVIFSGGNPSNDPNIETEAQVMNDLFIQNTDNYLASHDDLEKRKNLENLVEQSVLTRESQSQTTIENAFLTKNLLLQSNYYNPDTTKGIFIVTSDYHSKRSEKVFNTIFKESLIVDLPLLSKGIGVNSLIGYQDHLKNNLEYFKQSYIWMKEDIPNLTPEERKIEEDFEKKVYPLIESDIKSVIDGNKASINPSG